MLKGSIRKVLAVLVLTAVGHAHSAVIPLWDRASVQANDHVHWGHFGLPGSVISNPSVPISSFGGIAVSVSMPGLTQFSVHDQAAPSPAVFPPQFSGDFSPGDAVIAAGYGDGVGPLRISLGSMASAAGFQIDSFFLGTFTAQIEAFNNVGLSLGSFIRSGRTTSNSDGSALFLGIASDSQDISFLEVILTERPYGGVSQIFAINRLDFLSSFSSPGVNPDPLWPENATNASGSIPEPSAKGLVGLGLLALAALFFRSGRVSILSQ
jgi:hypothetical protein